MEGEQEQGREEETGRKDMNQEERQSNKVNKINLLFLISRKCAEGGEASSSSRVKGSACPLIAAAAAAQHTTTLARHNQRVMAVP